MTRSTLQPLRSRRCLPALAPEASAPAALPSAIEFEARRTVAAIGLIWLSAAPSFSRSLPPSRSRPSVAAA